jgi:phosphoserine phosphatase
MSTYIFLIRHGRTRWNRLKRYCGRLDVSLSREGKNQAAKLQSRLKDTDFYRIYSSPQRRAIETTKIIFKKRKFLRVNNLREIDFGVIEGMYYRDIIIKYGNVYKKWIRNPFRSRIPGSEPAVIFRKRVVSSINRIAASNCGKTVAVVCHGAVIGIYVANLKRKKCFWKFVPKATSVTLIEFKNGRPRLLGFNNIDHLENENKKNK